MPTIVTERLPNTFVGDPYDAVIVRAGARSGVAIIGDLPPGLVLNPLTGRISGVASTLGDYTFDVVLNAEDV